TQWPRQAKVNTRAALPTLRESLLQSMAGRSSIRTSGDVVALQFAVEGGATDAEHASGEGFVAFDLLEDALDGGAFDVFEVGGGERRRGGAVSGTRFGGGREIRNQFGCGVRRGPGRTRIEAGD